MEKKKLKKLELNKELILNLTSSEMDEVAGGTLTIFKPIKTGGGTVVESNVKCPIPSIADSCLETCPSMPVGTVGPPCPPTITTKEWELSY